MEAEGSGDRRVVVAWPNSAQLVLQRNFSLQPKFQREQETGRPHPERKLQSGVKTALEDGEKLQLGGKTAMEDAEK